MENNRILQQLNACIAVCNICYKASLSGEDVGSMSRCIALTRDCADVCQLASAALARDSELIDSILKLCAEACQACAAECEKHNHLHCLRCAEVCSHCVDICMAHVG